MAFIVKNISVDVASKNVFKSIIAKQYDIDSRFLKVRLTNEGKPINVLPTSVVTLNALRKDNKAKAFVGTVNEDGTVTFPIANWILELEGQVKCDISVIDSEHRKLTSSTFTITVEAASCSSTDINEDENYDILVSLIDKVSKMSVDSELLSESENPVQNKAVKAYIDEMGRGVPTDVKLTDTLLQLTANGVPVGEGVHIERTVHTNLFVDKLEGVKVHGATVFVVPHVNTYFSASTLTAEVYIRGRILHSRREDVSSPMLPVLSGMPTVLYDIVESGDIQNERFSDNETISIALGFSVDGAFLLLDEELWKETAVGIGGESSVSFAIDPSFSNDIYLIYDFRAKFTGENAVNTAAEFKAAFDEIMPFLDRLQIRTKQHAITETESEVIYNA